MATAAQIAKVREVAPAYADDTAYPDATIAAILDGWADRMIGRSYYLDCYDLALAYAAAHILTLQIRAASGGGGGGASVGSVASVSTGPLSISYAVASSWATTGVDAGWAQTGYGMLLVGLRDSRLGALPFVAV